VKVREVDGRDVGGRVWEVDGWLVDDGWTDAEGRC